MAGPLDTSSLAEQICSVVLEIGDADPQVIVTPGAQLSPDCSEFWATVQSLLQDSVQWRGVAFSTLKGVAWLARRQLPDGWQLSEMYPGTAAEAAPVTNVKLLLASCEWRDELQPLRTQATQLLALPELAAYQWGFGLNCWAQLSALSSCGLPGATGATLQGCVEQDELSLPVLHLRTQLDDALSIDSTKTPATDSLALGSDKGPLAELERLGLHDVVSWLKRFSKLLTVFTARRLDLVASLTADAPTPKGRLQLAGEVTLPDVGKLGKLPFILWWPFGTTQLFLRTREPIELVSGAPATDPESLGAKLRNLVASIVIRDLVVGISVEPPSLDLLRVSVGNKLDASSTDTLLGSLTVTDLQVQIELVPDARVLVCLELLICKDPSPCRLELRGELPDLVFMGRLKEGDQISLCALLEPHTEDNRALEWLHDALSGVSIGHLEMDLDLGSSNYALHLDVEVSNSEGGGDLELNLGGQRSVALNQVGFDLEYASGTLGVAFEGTWHVAGLGIRVRATHDDTGWTFSVESIGDSELLLGDFIKDLLEKLGPQGSASCPPCPEALSSLRLKGMSGIIHRNDDVTEFSLHCEADWTFDSGATAALILSIGKTGEQVTFDGQLLIGEHRFELTYGGGTSPSVIAAFYEDKQAQAASLADLLGIAFPAAQNVAALREVDVTLKEALIGSVNGNVVLGFVMDAKESFAKLPIVSLEFDDVQVLYLSRKIGTQDVHALIEVLPDTLIRGALGRLAPSDPQKKPSTGFSVSAQVNCSGVKQLLSAASADATAADAMTAAPGPSSGAEGAGLGGGKSGVAGSDGTTGPSATAPQPTSEPTWLQANRSLGPLYLERVGFGFADDHLLIALDAAVSIAGLTVALEGLSLQTPLDTFAPKFGLRGLGVDYRNNVVEIGAAFLLLGENSCGGSAVLKFEDLALSALGLYDEIKGHTSICVYAVLDYTIGGPPFFFVTGLAGAFGYNRRLSLPDLAGVASFPLVTFAQRPTGSEKPDPGSDLRMLEEKVPPAIGEYFLGVGVQFTSFEIAKSFALLTCSLGSRTEFNLLGLSNVVAPPNVQGSPAASIELVLKGSFLPEAGFLGIQAQLSPSSYLLSSACHLTGGFAFFSWFGANANAGDFVLTVGGYHPLFRKPDHYPDVPRLGLTWQQGSLSLKAQAYFALTPTTLMVGGTFEANWSSNSVRAWFKFTADMMLAWKPFHYSANVSVDMGVALTIGWLPLSVDVGAQLALEGPEFSGNANIHLGVISVKVTFGTGATAPKPMDWSEFRTFLPAQVCSISLADGVIVRSGEKKSDAAPPLADPHRLAVLIDSALPLHSAVHCSRRPEEKPTSTTEHPIALEKTTGSFGLHPMALGFAEFSSTQTLFVTRTGDDGNPVPVSDDFKFAPITKTLPRALWEDPASVYHDTPTVSEVLTGWRLTPRFSEAGYKEVTPTPSGKVFEDVWGVAARARGASDADERLTASLTMHLCSTHRPRLRAGTYTVCVQQDIEGRKQECQFKDTFSQVHTFEIPSETSSLGPGDVAAVYPPPGSNGDFANVLPHLVLSRSTLPWERSACGDKGHDSHPCLALLVLQEDEFSVSTNAGDSAVSIDVNHDVLMRILPTPSELALLTHVRCEGDLNQPGVASAAVLLSKSLPRQDAVNIVHLVCLAGLYDTADTFSAPMTSGRVRLGSLHSWKFSSREGGDPILDAINALNTAPIPQPGKALGWYRGPLGAPGTTSPDSAYAAARELGRLLALQSPAVAMGLMHRGSAYQRAATATENAAIHASPLQETVAAATVPELPSDILLWLKSCTLLQGIPFHYLIPDEAMLPPSSLRCFQVDEEWIWQLLDGALSLAPKGSTKTIPDEKDVLLRYLHAMSPSQLNSTMYGVLVRSRLVTDWPGFMPIAIAIDGTKALNPLTTLKLAPDVLLCLFDQFFEKVRIQKPPSVLHFEVRSDPTQADGERGLIDLSTWRKDGNSVDVACDVLTGRGLRTGLYRRSVNVT